MNSYFVFRLLIYINLSNKSQINSYWFKIFYSYKYIVFFILKKYYLKKSFQKYENFKKIGGHIQIFVIFIKNFVFELC